MIIIKRNISENRELSVEGPWNPDVSLWNWTVQDGCGFVSLLALISSKLTSRSLYIYKHLQFILSLQRSSGQGADEQRRIFARVCGRGRSCGSRWKTLRHVQSIRYAIERRRHASIASVPKGNEAFWKQGRPFSGGTGLPIIVAQWVQVAFSFKFFELITS